MLSTQVILSTTTNATGDVFKDFTAPGATFQGVITGTGVVSCTVSIEGSLDNTNFINLGDLTLSGTTTATDGFVNQGEWLFYRATTTLVTGTVSNITVMMSYAS